MRADDAMKGSTKVKVCRGFCGIFAAQCPSTLDMEAFRRRFCWIVVGAAAMLLPGTVRTKAQPVETPPLRLEAKIALTWPMRGAGGNFPMALDEAARRIVVAFRAPPKLGAFSIADGQSVKLVDLCGDADDVFVDAKRQRAYVSCGQGFIDGPFNSEVQREDFWR
jgi:hypothetical protein